VEPGTGQIAPLHFGRDDTLRTVGLGQRYPTQAKTRLEWATQPFLAGAESRVIPSLNLPPASRLFGDDKGRSGWSGTLGLPVGITEYKAGTNLRFVILHVWQGWKRHESPGAEVQTVKIREISHISQKTRDMGHPPWWQGGRWRLGSHAHSLGNPGKRSGGICSLQFE
jgi:hypothetical protein